jgi:diguanylate cyclase (GGDEF)-like protein
MNRNADLLFEYLKDVIYNPSKASLNIASIDEDFIMLGKGLMFFAQCFLESNDFTKALAEGHLGVAPPSPENEMAAPLKALHSSLKHLTWQSQQVANGDYSQHVDFMGDFADAFNTMIKQLAERQHNLENEIEISRKKTNALEQSNNMLSNITQHMPQQIVVMQSKTQEILFINNSVKTEIDNDKDYLEKLARELLSHNAESHWHSTEIPFGPAEDERYFRVRSYSLEWNEVDADAYVIADISQEKKHMKELEDYAYHDPMTHLYNRFYGMHTLNQWINEKISFSLVFADLDSLKYINDSFGHKEGDHYIITAANYLNLPDSISCRIGGDEFMVLIPETNFNEAFEIINGIYHKIQVDPYLNGKEFTYSFSFGIVSAEGGNNLSSGQVLSLADERMYEHKRLRKKERALSQ